MANGAKADARRHGLDVGRPSDAPDGARACRAALRCAADGKTAGETAPLRQIAEATVNFHLKNALRKLRVAHKTAGVAKALVLGPLRVRAVAARSAITRPPVTPTLSAC